jgi:hypothetical protein
LIYRSERKAAEDGGLNHKSLYCSVVVVLVGFSVDADETAHETE